MGPFILKVTLEFFLKVAARSIRVRLMYGISMVASSNLFCPVLFQEVEKCLFRTLI
jgi:hypothetical protein